MGTLFSPGSLLGDTSINGANTNFYSPDVSIGDPSDSSQYNDSGQDPTGGSGGNWGATLQSVVNDAFQAYTIAQTPTSYRAASPNSPAAIQAYTAANAQKAQSTMILFGGVILIAVVLYFLFKK